MAFESLEDRITPSVNWVGANADWNASASNWFDNVSLTNHIPTLADDVVIDNTSTVTVSTDIEIASLSLASGSGLDVISGALTLDNTSALSGNVSLSAGTLATKANSTLAGSTSWTGGTLTSTSAGSWTNNGAFAITGNLSPAAVFNSAGNVLIGANSTFTLTNGGTSTGDWDIAANGSLTIAKATYFFDGGTDVTGAGNVVVTDIGGPGTLNVGDDAADVVNVSNLRVGQSFSAGTANVTGTLHVTGQMDLGPNNGNGLLAGTGNVTVGGLLGLFNGAMSGPGTTSANGGMLIDIGGNGMILKDGRHLDNNAAAIWPTNSSHSLEFRNGAVFTNNGTVDLQVDASFSNSNGGGDLPNAIFNTGIFKKTGGANAANTISVPFNNNGGTVDVQVGELLFRGGGTSTGPWTVAAAAQLSFFDSTYDLNADLNAGLNAGSKVTGDGTVLFAFSTVNMADTYSASHTVIEFSAHANFNADSSTTTLTFPGLGDGTTLGGSGNFTVNGLLTWKTGTIAGAGTVFAKGDITLDGNSVLTGRTLDLAANHTLTWLSTGFSMSNGAVFNNHGTFDAQNDASFNNGGGATSNFINNGTFKKSAGTGLTTIVVPFANNGTIDVQTGTVSVNGPSGGLSNFPLASTASIDNSPTGATESGTTVTITSSNGHQFLVVGQTVTISGVAEAGYNGTFTVTAVPNSTTFQYTAATSGLPASGNGGASFLSTSTLTGGTYLISGTLQFTGANIVTNAANIVLNGPDSKFLTNSTFPATDALANFAINAAGGNFTLQNGRSLTTGGAFSNLGNVTVNSGASLTVPAGNAYSQSSGTTTLNGSLTADAVNLNGGVLKGAGTVNGALVNAADVAAGNSPGTLIVNGDYTQTAAGVLDVEIAGTSSFDRLQISGTATLGGTINVARLGGFAPVLNDVFQIMTFGSVTGDFALKNGYALGNALAFSEQFNPTNLSLVVGKAKLSFQVQPPAAPIAGQPFQVTVLVSDASGLPLLTDNVDQVTLTLNQNSFHGGGNSVTQPVVNGVATFNLTIDQGAGGYSLTAGGNGFANVVSTTFEVQQAPSITSTDNVTFTVGSNDTFTIQTIGFPAPVLDIGSFNLPTGISFVSNGDGTATLAGTPGANMDGVYAFTVTANNGIGTQATQNFTLTVNRAVITSADHVTFTAGTFNTFTVTTTSPLTPSLSASAIGVPGVTFIDNGDGTATLSGTPTGNGGGLHSFTITEHTGIGADTTQSFVLTVNQTAAITSVNHATFKTGVANSFTVTTVGFPLVTLDDPAAVLPAGITFTNNGDGTATLAGTPSGVAGVYPFNLTAFNAITPVVTQVFTLTVTAPPIITSVDHVPFTVGAAGTFTVTATAGLPIATTFKLIGALPTGVIFTDNKNGTATLKGTPAAGKGGVYPLSIVASNAGPFSTTQNFTLTVNQAPSFSSAAAVTFNVGVNNSFTITTKGFPAATITNGVAFPAGLTFHDNGNGTATLSGVPTATGGPTTVALTAHISGLPDATQQFKLTVAQPPVFPGSHNVIFQVGQTNSFTVQTTPGTPATTILSVSGVLPTGLTFTDNKNGTGKIAGTPAVGNYNLTLVASNGVAKTIDVFHLTVNQVPSFTSAASAFFTAGQTGSFTIKTKGFPTAAITHGTLPSGISFVDNGNGTATLSGAATSAGIFPITLTAHNGIGIDAVQNFTLTVKQPPTFTSLANFTMTVGQINPFNFTTASGNPTATTLTLTGALPTGVTFTDNKNGTATLTGKPAAGKGGVYHLTITASNAAPAKSTQAFTLTVNQAPVITSAAPATFSLNQFGSFTIKTAGFPVAAFAQPTVPAGVSFTDNGNGTATLSGTPTGFGIFNFDINASNGVSPAANQHFKLTVNQPPVFTSVATPPPFLVNTLGSFTITTAPGVPTPTTITIAGKLPTGVVFTDKKNGAATLIGKPAAGTGGAYHLTITAINGASSRTQQSFTLMVNQTPSITSVNKATFTVAKSGAFTITTKGFPLAAIGLAGLPAGLTLTDNGNGTATVSGTPLAGTAGVYHLTATAQNSVGNVSQSFTLTVNQPPIVTSAASTTFTHNVLNTFTFTASGVPAAKYTLIGTLPSGLTFVSNSNGTATLKGIPTSVRHFLFTISVTNGVLPVTYQLFDLDVT